MLHTWETPSIFFKGYVCPGDIPWPGTIFGMTVVAVWYWCTDQVNSVGVCEMHEYVYVILFLLIAKHLVSISYTHTSFKGKHFY